MTTFVWTDEVPESSRDYLTPGKRYLITDGNLVIATIKDDDDDTIFVLIPGCCHIDGRAWNVEIVADPAPPFTPEEQSNG